MPLAIAVTERKGRGNVVESFSLGLVRLHQVSQKPAQFLITEHRHTRTDNLPAEVNTHLQQEKKKRDEVTEKRSLVE